MAVVPLGVQTGRGGGRRGGVGQRTGRIAEHVGGADRKHGADEDADEARGANEARSTGFHAHPRPRRDVAAVYVGGWTDGDPDTITAGAGRDPHRRARAAGRSEDHTAAPDGSNSDGSDADGGEPDDEEAEHEDR